MIRFLYLLIFVIMTTVSCSKEKEIYEGIRLYNEGLTQSAFVKFREGLLHYSTIKAIRSQNLYFSPLAIFSLENTISLMHPEQHSYNFPREVVSAWYDPQDDVCAVTDGVVVYLSIHGKESILNNPSQEPIKAVAHATNTYFLCGKELFVYNVKDDHMEKLSAIEFASPEAFKYYNAYIDIVDDKLIVIVGIAGSYNLWVITKNGDADLSSVRVASWKHSLHDGALFVIKGSAGNWEFRSINLKSKQEKIIKNFTTLIDIHMTRHGVVINTGEQLYIYLLNDEIYSLPFMYSIKGETRDSMVVENGSTAIISSEKFFAKILHIAKDTGCCIVKK